ncbi:DoxX family protein [Candidatus Woesearchaeota archaeon]|nr:DoxX family protein [Candidatus Woesearchaeota archaeon]
MPKNNSISQWTLTLLRLILGIIFTYHGYLKLFAPGGFTGTVDFFTKISIPLPVYSALIVSVVEFVGGLFLIFGILSWWSSILLLIDMLVAFFVVHWKNGLLVSKGGYEFVLILIAVLIVIIANGPGKLSMGKMLSKKKYLY